MLCPSSLPLPVVQLSHSSPKYHSLTLTYTHSRKINKKTDLKTNILSEISIQEKRGKWQRKSYKTCKCRSWFSVAIGLSDALSLLLFFIVPAAAEKLILCAGENPWFRTCNNRRLGLEAWSCYRLQIKALNWHLWVMKNLQHPWNTRFFIVEKGSLDY